MAINQDQSNNKDKLLSISYGIGLLFYLSIHVFVSLDPGIRDPLLLRLIAIPVFILPILATFQNRFTKYVDLTIFCTFTYSSIHSLYILYLNPDYFGGTIVLFNFSIILFILIAFVENRIYGKLLGLINVINSIVILNIIVPFIAIIFVSVINFMYLFGYFAFSFRQKSTKKIEELTENLDIIISNSPSIYFVLDNHGNFLISRGTGLKKIGLEPDQLVGQNAYELYGDYPEMINAITKAFQGEPGEHMSYVEESDIYWKTKIIPVNSPKNEIKIIGIAEDVTAIKKQEESEKELHNIQRMESLGRLAAGISHEFNNILTIYQNITDLLLLDDNLDNQQIELIHNIGENNERGKNITQQLLSYAKKGDIKPTFFSVNEFMIHFNKMFNIATNNKSIEINVDLYDDDLMIFFDKSSLYQVILNIILNSVDAIDSFGTISISTDKIDNGNRLISDPMISPFFVKISISDTGGGMDEVTLNRIFDPFFSTKNNGLGLGLSTSKAIIENSGGHIDVISEKNKGTTINICIPLISPHEVVSLDQTDTNFNISLVNLSGHTILLVDDESSIVTLLAKLFTNKHAKVLIATNIHQATSILQNNNSIDVVLCDIKIEAGNGLDFYHSLSNTNISHYQNKFVFMSGYADQIIEIRKLQQHYPIEFIQKPFRIENVFEKVLGILSIDYKKH